MGPVIEIPDAGDPRVTEYVRLRDVALRSRFERPHGLFIAEGELVLARALRAGFQPRSVLTQRAFLPTLAPLLAGHDDIPVYLLDAATVEAVTGFPVHRGSLASMHRRPEPPPPAVLAAASRVVVLENVVNPTNLGAIFRSAAALGMDAAILTPRCADPLYRRSIRVSMGEVFTLAYARLASWPGDLALLRAHGFTVVALTPDPDAVALDAFDAAAEPRLALLLGTEGPGLSEHARGAADVRVRIPMSRGVDSLNVAAAAAVACWAMRRRASGYDTAPIRCRHPGKEADVSTIEKSIEVNVPINVAYNQWTQFEEFPQFMEGVEEVRQLDDKRLHWKASILGVTREWDAEIVDQKPDQQVAWRAIGGTKNDGVVMFFAVPMDTGKTRVALRLEFEPEGAVEKVGDALNLVERRAQGDLERFKEFIEKRGAATGGWRGVVKPSGEVTPDAG